jgi:hypothetical protein
VSDDINIDIVRRMCQAQRNGVFRPDACLALCDEIERLRAEVKQLGDAGDALFELTVLPVWLDEPEVIAWMEIRREQ